MGPTEHLVWDHADPPKVHFPHSQFILIHYTTHRVPHLAYHPVPHQISIHYRYLVKKMPNPTYRCVTYGKTQMNKGGR